ncbi:hypothetical protein DD573_29830 [Klebsiella pneumoniae]|nr:hypothetical protein DD573_29830 [Klebsiella pneumoniae]
MISLDIHGHYSLLIKVMHFKHLGNLLKLYKTRKILRLHPLEVIMGVNLKTKILNYFVMNMVLSIIFLHLEPLNKMELLRGKIGHWKKLLELY